MTRRGLTLFVAALLLPLPAARTAPLGKEGCAMLKTEQAQLEHGGARGNMAKGPQWAKTNLEPEKLDQVRRLLEIDEQLLFRCNGKPLVNLPKDPDPDPAAREPGSEAAKAAKVPKAPKVPKKDAVKKAAAPASEPAATGVAKEQPAAKKAAPAPAPKTPSDKAPADKAAEGDPGKKTAQKAAPAKKAKAKSDDAYRAPASEPGADPFANQLAPKK